MYFRCLYRFSSIEDRVPSSVGACLSLCGRFIISADFLRAYAPISLDCRKRKISRPCQNQYFVNAMPLRLVSFSWLGNI